MNNSSDSAKPCSFCGKHGKVAKMAAAVNGGMVKICVSCVSSAACSVLKAAAYDSDNIARSKVGDSRIRDVTPRALDHITLPDDIMFCPGPDVALTCSLEPKNQSALSEFSMIQRQGIGGSVSLRIVQATDGVPGFYASTADLEGVYLHIWPEAGLEIGWTNWYVQVVRGVRPSTGTRAGALACFSDKAVSVDADDDTLETDRRLWKDTSGRLRYRMATYNVPDLKPGTEGNAWVQVVCANPLAHYGSWTKDPSLVYMLSNILWVASEELVSQRDQVPDPENLKWEVEVHRAWGHLSNRTRHETACLLEKIYYDLPVLYYVGSLP